MSIDVDEVTVEDIKIGDTIWSEEDSDWLKVHRIIPRDEHWEIRFLRADQSLADFDKGATALRRVQP